MAMWLQGVTLFTVYNTVYSYADFRLI